MKIIIDTTKFTLQPEVINDGELPLETIAKELRSIDHQAIETLLGMISNLADPNYPLITMKKLNMLSVKEHDERLDKFW